MDKIMDHDLMLISASEFVKNVNGKVELNSPRFKAIDYLMKLNEYRRAHNLAFYINPFKAADIKDNEKREYYSLLEVMK